MSSKMRSNLDTPIVPNDYFRGLPGLQLVYEEAKRQEKASKNVDARALEKTARLFRCFGFPAKVKVEDEIDTLFHLRIKQAIAYYQAALAARYEYYAKEQSSRNLPAIDCRLRIIVAIDPERIDRHLARSKETVDRDILRVTKKPKTYRNNHLPMVHYLARFAKKFKRDKRTPGVRIVSLCASYARCNLQWRNEKEGTLEPFEEDLAAAEEAFFGEYIPWTNGIGVREYLAYTFWLFDKYPEFPALVKAYRKGECSSKYARD